MAALTNSASGSVPSTLPPSFTMVRGDRPNVVTLCQLRGFRDLDQGGELALDLPSIPLIQQSHATSLRAHRSVPDL
jgi:hypothetical protein